jgi:hypothetical protein
VQAVADDPELEVPVNNSEGLNLNSDTYNGPVGGLPPSMTNNPGNISADRIEIIGLEKYAAC